MRIAKAESAPEPITTIRVSPRLQLKAGCEEFTDLSDAKLTRGLLLKFLVDSGDISFTRSVGVRVLFPDGAISTFKVDSRDATVEDLKKRICKRLGFQAYSQQLFCMGLSGLFFPIMFLLLIFDTVCARF